MFSHLAAFLYSVNQLFNCFDSTVSVTSCLLARQRTSSLICLLLPQQSFTSSFGNRSPALLTKTARHLCQAAIPQHWVCLTQSIRFASRLSVSIVVPSSGSFLLTCPSVYSLLRSLSSVSRLASWLLVGNSLVHCCPRCVSWMALFVNPVAQIFICFRVKVSVPPRLQLFPLLCIFSSFSSLELMEMSYLKW
jgi:hypothetical protein